eukprot:TRINITY_DN2639_c0_g1_i4.p1 TRINITY_DN2639_c0_g1~~TRINITY_DN2639_c0_g1_i4.p1  ORF type:complete len:117 (+),score=10.07 TRINITY_DN2639_c0_g1_i4:13-363(+)
MEHDPRPKQVPLNAEELHAIRKNPRLLNESTYKPQITKLTRSPPVAAQVLLNGTPNPRLGKIPKTKFSSTSTMFLNQENNVLTPGVADVLRWSLAGIIRIWEEMSCRIQLCSRFSE